jgi:hypothetical protein
VPEGSDDEDLAGLRAAPRGRGGRAARAPSAPGCARRAGPSPVRRWRTGVRSGEPGGSPTCTSTSWSPGDGSASPTGWRSARAGRPGRGHGPGRDWAMLGPARIEFETTDDLEVGRFRLERVEADERERDWPPPARPARPPLPVGPHTAMLPTSAFGPRCGLTSWSWSRAASRSGPGRWPPPRSSAGRAVRQPLADPGVSRNHARVVREGDDFIVEDLRRPTHRVNGQPVRRRRHPGTLEAGQLDPPPGREG